MFGCCEPSWRSSHLCCARRFCWLCVSSPVWSIFGRRRHRRIPILQTFLFDHLLWRRLSIMFPMISSKPKSIAPASCCINQGRKYKHFPRWPLTGHSWPCLGSILHSRWLCAQAYTSLESLKILYPKQPDYGLHLQMPRTSHQAIWILISRMLYETWNQLRL